MVAVLQLQDGGNSLGRVTNFLALGKSGAATNTFSNNNPITILDNSPADIYPSTIAVSGLGPATTRVTATLTGLGHSYPADMDILLVGPLGQKVLLMSDAVGGNSFSGLNLTFADSAPSGLPFSTPITSGTYKPTDWTDFGPPDTFPAPAPSGPYGTNLSILNGTDPNGTWSLYIVDDTGGDSGNLTGGWSLTIAATTPAICCGPDSSADLAVSMTASQPSIPIGSNVTFTVTLTNLGPNFASDVVFSNPLPAGFLFVSANSATGSVTNDNGTVLWALGTLTNNARGTLTITVTGVLPGTITNTAFAISRAADPNPANSSPATPVAVVPPSPVALFSAGPLIGPVPLTVNFTDESAGGGITNRFWNFGDGSTTNATLTNFTHVYLAGTNTVSLTVTGPGGTNTLTRFNYIVATNRPPVLAVTPAGLDFGTFVTGLVTNQDFQIVNTGGLPLSGSATSSPPFLIQNGSPYSLAPGQTGQVSIGFAPITPGSFNNVVTFTSNGGNSTNTVAGSATNPPPKFAVSPALLDFGSVIISQIATQSFELVNTGAVTLTGNITTSQPFDLPTSSLTLGAGQTGLIAVTFSPLTSGSFSNIIVFNTSGGTITNSVLGIGLTPPQLAILPSSINFGTVAVGTNAQASFTVTNTGGAALSNGLATVSGGPFTILSGTPFSLPGFGSTNLVVRFTPASAANFSNVVLFTTSNAGNSTNTLLGIGAVIPIAAFSATPTNGL
ncbi:MAG TPA: choice-of-anchor D domain-containing protein, partial [Methylomirabilota bacterium]|nr:choice-of-anchor D domain-containing protein [Methylomirabilota bacterium]